MWVLGDYTAVATEVISGLGPVLVEAAGVAPGAKGPTWLPGRGTSRSRLPGRRRRGRLRPHAGAAAGRERLADRVGGTIGLVSWTPEGFIGQMFATMKPYLPPPPARVEPPPR